MESKIIKQEKNPFLEREELTLEIKNKNTPTADEVKTAIGKDPNLTIIKKINTNFGNQTFIAKAIVYDNPEAKNKIETIPQKIKKKTESTKKEETTTEPEQEQEKPKEETKPEKQTE